MKTYQCKVRPCASRWIEQEDGSLIPETPSDKCWGHGKPIAKVTADALIDAGHLEIVQ